jgi:hypothetical protein
VKKADLELLGYSGKWVEYGFLTPDLLTRQVARFHTGEDRNTEHYRYWAFRELREKPAVTEVEFERYVELAESDPDSLMGRAALIDLIDHRGVTDEQRETLLSHPRVQELPRLVKRERLLAELRRPNVTLETLRRCVDEGSGAVHLQLLRLEELPDEIIEALREKGATKAVRHMARGMLRDSR